MNFREAKKEDIENILEVISHAKEYMKKIILLNGMKIIPIKKVSLMI